jgi:adenosylcobinamide kinase / adenosylcobinamide-phosphate guanylyltransferase
VDVRLLGSGGRDGWPQPGCGCASCNRATSSGHSRGRCQVLVDGMLRFEPGRPPGGADGYLLRPAGAGWDLTAPDGGRLLIAPEPGTAPEPPAGAAPYDVALLDLLDSPAQLGALRARGLVHAGTKVAPLHADHRISSEAELSRRCGLWRVCVPQDGMAAAEPQPPSMATGQAPAPAGRAPAPALAALTLAAPRAPALAHRTLVLGGARSGKSSEAELRLAAEPQVTYLAAGPWPDAAEPDPEWARRVGDHRARRPAWWRTVESTDVPGVLKEARGAVLVDGIGTWLAAVLAESGAWSDLPGAEEKIAQRVTELVTAWRHSRARVVAVSDQVGDGVVPPTHSGRLFRDQLGSLNQRLAAESEETVLVVAGRVITLPP